MPTNGSLGCEHQADSLPQGTGVSQLFIANLNRAAYCFGDRMVGSLPLPPKIPDFFTYISNALSSVNCEWISRVKNIV